MVSTMGRSDLEDIERRLKAYRGDPRWVQRQVARERAIRQRRIVLASFASLAVIFAATGAQAAPGVDGLYRARQSSELIGRYLAAARRAHALLILDIQPGHSPFMREVHAYARWLREPDVGIALDPEWSLPAGQTPGSVIGSTTAGIVNHVQAYMSQIVKNHNLPQKLLIVHRFTTDMIANARTLRAYPGVALTVNVDGYGDQENKVSKYDYF